MEPTCTRAHAHLRTHAHTHKHSHTLSLSVSIPCPSVSQLRFWPLVFHLWPGGFLEKQGEKWGPIKVSLQAQSVCQVASNI